jgi:hypothetical protein
LVVAGGWVGAVVAVAAGWQAARNILTTTIRPTILNRVELLDMLFSSEWHRVMDEIFVEMAISFYDLDWLPYRSSTTK